MDELIFEWDVRKDASNQSKHGVAFEEAKTVFTDPFARLIVDPDHSLEEERFILMGESLRGRILIVCHCTKDEDKIWVISARKADRHERKQYEEFRHA